MRALTSQLLLATAMALSGCGVNAFSVGEKKDPAEDATLALEREDPDTAIDILEKALESDPENPQLLSILALAYAQRAGVEPLTIAQSIASRSAEYDSEDADTEADTATSSSSSSTESMIGLFGVMPEATEDSLDDIDYAVTILATQIEFDDRLPGDNFKLAIYQTAALVMHLKILDTDGDGTLSVAEISDLSDTAAVGLVAQLASAAASLSGDDSGSAAKAAATLQAYQNGIDAADGDNQADQLRNYLAASSGSSTVGTDTDTGL